jgi:hypothetical protein
MFCKSNARVSFWVYCTLLDICSKYFFIDIYQKKWILFILGYFTRVGFGLDWICNTFDESVLTHIKGERKLFTCQGPRKEIISITLLISYRQFNNSSIHSLSLLRSSKHAYNHYRIRMETPPGNGITIANTDSHIYRGELDLWFMKKNLNGVFIFHRARVYSIWIKTLKNIQLLRYCKQKQNFATILRSSVPVNTFTDRT